MLFFMFIEHSVYHPFLLLSLLPNFQKRDGGGGGELDRILVFSGGLLGKRG